MTDIIQLNKELQRKIEADKEHYMKLVTELDTKLSPSSQEVLNREDIATLYEKQKEVKKVAKFYPELQFESAYLLYYEGKLDQCMKRIEDAEYQEKVQEMKKRPDIAEFISRASTEIPDLEDPDMRMLLDKALTL